MEATPQYFTPDLRPPKLRHSIMELGRVIMEIGSTAMLGPLLKSLPQGDGHTIMTIPGFMGADGSTSQLRKFLNNRGYNAIPWGLGRNAAEVRSQNIDDFLDHRAEMEDTIAARVEEEFQISNWGLVEGGHDYDRLNCSIQLHSAHLFVQSIIVDNDLTKDIEDQN